MKRRHFLAEWLSVGAGVLVTATIGRNTSKASGRSSTGTSPRRALPPRQSRPRVVLKNEQANGMNVHHVCKWCMVAALVAVGTNLGLHKAIGAQPGPADPEEGVQVLTRGPVHEAFAETVTFDPEPGIVVPKAPSFGLAASGAPCRPAANGCPGIGASPGRAFSGLPGTGPTPK